MHFLLWHLLKRLKRCLQFLHILLNLCNIFSRIFLHSKYHWVLSLHANITEYYHFLQIRCRTTGSASISGQDAKLMLFYVSCLFNSVIIKITTAHFCSFDGDWALKSDNPFSVCVRAVCRETRAAAVLNAVFTVTWDITAVVQIAQTRSPTSGAFWNAPYLRPVSSMSSVILPLTNSAMRMISHHLCN